MDLTDRVSLDDQRLLASWFWPERWRATLSMPGRLRRARQKRLRAAAVAEAQLRPLRAAGRSCASCAGRRGRICLDQSDFQGDAIIEPGGLCSSWR